MKLQMTNTGQHCYAAHTCVSWVVTVKCVNRRYDSSPDNRARRRYAAACPPPVAERLPQEEEQHQAENQLLGIYLRGLQDKMIDVEAGWEEVFLLDQNLFHFDFEKSGDDLPEVAIMSELLRHGAEVNHADKLWEQADGAQGRGLNGNNHPSQRTQWPAEALGFMQKVDDLHAQLLKKNQQRKAEIQAVESEFWDKVYQYWHELHSKRFEP